MIVETLKSHTVGGITITIDVVDFCEGSPWMEDLYTGTDQHEGGKTIANPEHHSNGYKYYIGQYTPAQLASDYAKQGRENPSKEAYASLQKELEHYIHASDCSLRATISKAGVELATNYGISFDHSHVQDETREEMALLMLKEHGLDFISEAVSEARDTLAALAA